MPSTAPPQITILSRSPLDSGRVVGAAAGKVAIYTARSPVKESANEDALALILVDEARAVLALADGVGGQPFGAEAAEVALRSLAQCVERGTDDLRTAVLDGFELANTKVAELAVGAATTLAAVVIEGTAVRPYHVGDSNILVTGQRGKVKLYTVSHSPMGYAVEAGLLNEEEAIHHADRHLVSNTVGSPEMRIEVGGTLRLSPRDTMVIGTDGLFDNLHLAEIVERVRKGPLPAAARTLADDARRRMLEPDPQRPSHPDDLTFLIYRSRP